MLLRLEGGVVLAGPLVVAPGGGVLPAVVPVAARRHVALLDLARVGHAPDVPQLDALVLAVGDQVPPVPLRTEQAFLFRVTGAIVDQQTKHDPGLEACEDEQASKRERHSKEAGGQVHMCVTEGSLTELEPKQKRCSQRISGSQSRLPQKGGREAAKTDQGRMTCGGSTSFLLF